MKIDKLRFERIRVFLFKILELFVYNDNCLNCMIKSIDFNYRKKKL